MTLGASKKGNLRSSSDYLKDIKQAPIPLINKWFYAGTVFFYNARQSLFHQVIERIIRFAAFNNFIKKEANGRGMWNLDEVCFATATYLF